MDEGTSGESVSEQPTVLVVDDESRLADLFGTWIETTWPVAVAYDGEEALEAMSDSIEVVLLDRRMPGLSGDEVLERIREAGYDCRVVMVTAVDPDFDIIEMGFDDYVVKPVSKEELLEVTETVMQRAEYESDIQEYYALVSKKAVLETELPDRKLEDNEEYQQLHDRVTRLEEDVDATVSSLSDHDDFVGAFKDLDAENGA